MPEVIGDLFKWVRGFPFYSSGTSSNKSDTDTPRAFASRSSVVVFTPLKGSLHILFMVKKDTSEALDKLDMLNPFDSAISFTLRRIILLPFGSMACANCSRAKLLTELIKLC